jgi:hypothetical protein
MQSVHAETFRVRDLFCGELAPGCPVVRWPGYGGRDTSSADGAARGCGYPGLGSGLSMSAEE